MKTCRTWWALEIKFSEKKSDDEDKLVFSILTDSRGDVHDQRVTAGLVMITVGGAKLRQQLWR